MARGASLLLLQRLRLRWFSGHCNLCSGGGWSLRKGRLEWHALCGLSGGRSRRQALSFTDIESTDAGIHAGVGWSCADIELGLQHAQHVDGARLHCMDTTTAWRSTSASARVRATLERLGSHTISGDRFGDSRGRLAPREFEFGQQQHGTLKWRSLGVARRRSDDAPREAWCDARRLKMSRSEVDRLEKRFALHFATVIAVLRGYTRRE